MCYLIKKLKESLFDFKLNIDLRILILLGQAVFTIYEQYNNNIRFNVVETS